MLRRFFRQDPARLLAETLYARIVEQARRPVLYLQGGVADTVDGRFDLIVLHTFLVLRRLKKDPVRTARLAQMVFDVMFENMDSALREMGVGDLSVGKKIKGMAEAFYGRVEAYEKALSAGDPAALQTALQRNLYRAAEVAPDALARMAAYVRRLDGALAAQPLDDILAGTVRFVAYEEVQDDEEADDGPA